MPGDAPRPRHGEIWIAELDTLRPVVVMHRDVAGRNLTAILVAPLTSTIRDIPTAVRLGPEHGLDRECVAALDNLTLLARTVLVRRVGGAGPGGHERPVPRPVGRGRLRLTRPPSTPSGRQRPFGHRNIDHRRLGAGRFTPIRP